MRPSQSRYGREYRSYWDRLGGTAENIARQLRRKRAEQYAEDQVRANFPKIDVDNATEVIAFREQCIADYIASHDLPLGEAAP